MQPLIAQVHWRVEHGDAREGIGIARFGNSADGAAKGTADGVVDTVAAGLDENPPGNGCEIVGEPLPEHALGQQGSIGVPLAAGIDGDHPVVGPEPLRERRQGRRAEPVGVVEQGDGLVAAPVQAADAHAAFRTGGVFDPPAASYRSLEALHSQCPVP